MAELTVPSKKRRALAEMLLSQQGPAPQMVGNQMVYSPEAGIASAVAKGVGGFMYGRELKAEEGRDKARREQLAKYLTPATPAKYADEVQFSGGAPELAGIAPSGLPSPVVTQEARPASFDARSAIADALLAGDNDAAANYATMAKAFADDSGEGEVKNIYDPSSGRVTAALISKTGQRKDLPFALYNNPNETFDPLSGNTVRIGGTPLDLVGQRPQGGNLPFPAPVPSNKVTKVIPGETAQARKLRMEQERQARAEARDEERLRISREQAQAQIREKDAKRTAPIRDNNASIAKIDDAIAEIDKYPKGLGAQNMGGDGISQRLDPKGVGVRNRVSNIGSLQIKDRSGAAVSAAEMKRLGFLPLVTDTPEAAKKKLQDLKAWIELENSVIGGDAPKPASAKVGTLRIE